VLHKITVRAREAFYFTPVMLRKTWIERECYRKVCTRICGALRCADSMNALYVKVTKSLLYWLINELRNPGIRPMPHCIVC